MLVQIVTKGVPAAPHTHHHVFPEDLQGARGRGRQGEFVLSPWTSLQAFSPCLHPCTHTRVCGVAAGDPYGTGIESHMLSEVEAKLTNGRLPHRETQHLTSTGSSGPGLSSLSSP